jgi:hypothetical protein
MIISLIVFITPKDNNKLMVVDEGKVREWVERFREAREIRRKYADWDFIKRKNPKLKVALEYYIETGDFRGTSLIAEMGVDEFVEFSKEMAKIPSTL